MTQPVSIELGEYKQRTVPGPTPTDADQRLAARLRADDDVEARLDVTWLANGDAHIKASSWIGVVHFTDLHIAVVPKFVGGSLQVLRMLEYAAGVGLLSRLPAQRPLPPGGSDLFDLICLLLAEEAHSLLKEGLLRDYRPVTDTIDALRGRLRYRDQLFRRFGQLDRLHCDFDDYDADTVDNQLVCAALHIARRRASDPEIRFAALRLAAIFDEACTPPSADADHYRARISYDRRNDHYRPSHELAALILDGIAFDDLYDTSGGQVSAFMLDMNNVFERFVTRLAHDALQPPSPLRTAEQVRLRAVIRDDETDRTYSTLRPDLVLEDPRTGRRTPVDIKYKLYDTKKLSTADIYQAFMYAFALGDEHDRRAGLIHPASSHSTGPALSVKPLTGPIAAHITGLGIDVPAILDALKSPARQAALDDVRTMLENLVQLPRFVTYDVSA